VDTLSPAIFGVFTIDVGADRICVLALEITDRRGVNSACRFEIFAPNSDISASLSPRFGESTFSARACTDSTSFTTSFSFFARLFSLSLYISRNFIRRCFSRVMPADLGKEAGNDFTL
jgi:hypothetical protein